MTKALRPMVMAMLLTGAALSLPGASAQAQSYPRVTGSGENLMVDYGPMGQATLVGGGRVMVTMPNGMDVNIVHFDAMFTQRPHEGYVPLTIGSGESMEQIYVPRAMIDMLRNARATMPAGR